MSLLRTYFRRILLETGRCMPLQSPVVTAEARPVIFRYQQDRRASSTWDGLVEHVLRQHGSSDQRSVDAGAFLRVSRQTRVFLYS